MLWDILTSGSNADKGRRNLGKRQTRALPSRWVSRFYARPKLELRPGRLWIPVRLPALTSRYHLLFGWSRCMKLKRLPGRPWIPVRFPVLTSWSLNFFLVRADTHSRQSCAQTLFLHRVVFSPAVPPSLFPYAHLSPLHDKPLRFTLSAFARKSCSRILAAHRRVGRLVDHLPAIGNPVQIGRNIWNSRQRDTRQGKVCSRCALSECPV